MALNLKYLIEQLEIVDPEIIALRIWVVSSFGNAMVMRGILDRQCANREQTNCYSCSDDGICSVITGVAHLDLGEINTAIKKLEDGNQHFRSKDETWNSVIGLVLLGKAYEKSGNNHQTLIEYKKALHLLTENYIRVHANDYDKLDKARPLETELNAHLAQSFSPRPSPESHIQAYHFVAKPNINTVGNERAYLSLFSIPIYGTVMAGEEGVVHIDPVENTSTIVDKVELEGRPYAIFNVGGTASRDRQITLIPQESYGWLWVRGLSMNAWNIPLNEKDYVLFRKSQMAENNEFVIVSSRDTSVDNRLIVKRFDELNGQFLSRSTDTSRSYAPIPMDDDHKIVGVVIAVAKPLNSAVSAPSPVTPSMKQTSVDDHLMEERRLYNKLLTRALGDKEKIERLIIEALKKTPRASHFELLKIVDEGWITDGN
jgi:hypothetical protein